MDEDLSVEALLNNHRELANSIRKTLEEVRAADSQVRDYHQGGLPPYAESFRLTSAFCNNYEISVIRTPQYGVAPEVWRQHLKLIKYVRGGRAGEPTINPTDWKLNSVAIVCTRCETPDDMHAPVCSTVKSVTLATENGVPWSTKHTEPVLETLRLAHLRYGRRTATKHKLRNYAVGKIYSLLDQVGNATGYHFLCVHSGQQGQQTQNGKRRRSGSGSRPARSASSSSTWSGGSGGQGDDAGIRALMQAIASIRPDGSKEYRGHFPLMARTTCRRKDATSDSDGDGDGNGGQKTYFQSTAAPAVAVVLRADADEVPWADEGCTLILRCHLLYIQRVSI
jgi:hypothetical protein